MWWKYILWYVFVVLTNVEAISYTVTLSSSHGVDNETCCQNSNLPCNKLELALKCVHQQVPGTTYLTMLISEGHYVLTIQSLSTFVNWPLGITIKGTVPLNNESQVIITCEAGAGLTFIRTNNVSLQNIQLSRCGKIQNSTSREFTGIDKFLNISVAVYFLLCKDVTIISTTVSESDGTGVVMYNTVGSVTILNSHFRNNSMLDDTQQGGGGLYIEFGYCLPGDSSCIENGPNVPPAYTSGARYYIAECYFEYNVANVAKSGDDSTFILPQKSNHLAFGRGGGLSVFFKGVTSNCSVIVNDSSFYYNRALWGGGIFIEYLDNSSSNQFYVYNTVLDSNYLFHQHALKRGTGGGGSRVGFLYFNDTHAYSNSVLFENCSFINNSAYFGGGLSFFTAREPETSTPSNSLVFTGCQWISNVARAGSAVDLSVWHPSTHGALTQVYFETCKFENNSGKYTSMSGKLLGIGAMYLDSIPVTISGNTTFYNNTHSALAAVNTGIYFDTSSSTSFVCNSGHSGGAISLMGFAFIKVHKFSSLIFINNSASLYGGAIFGQSIGQHDLISSHNCFIRYYDIVTVPENWICEFYFEGNVANGRPNSIYATSLLPCLWGTVYGSVEANASKVFCWNSTVWRYSSGSCKSEVQISPAKFKSTNPAKLIVYPGMDYTLPVVVLDDRLEDVTNTTVFSATSQSSDLQIDGSSEYISNRKIRLHGIPNKTGSLALNTIEPRIAQTEILVDILQCPLGMIEEKDNNSNLVVCKCGGNFGGLVHCNSYTFNTSIQSGYWIGSYTPKGSNHSTTVVGACPYCSKPLDLYTYNSNSSYQDRDLCDSIDRQGRLCGKCKSGYCPSNNVFGFTCANCSTIPPIPSWILFVLRDLGLIVLCFIIFFLFDIRFVSARANALVFFAQVVPVAFTIDAAGSLQVFKNSKTQDVLSVLYTVPLNLFNLDFQWFSICLGREMSSLTYISLGYVSAIFPLLLIAIVLGVSTLWDFNVKFCLEPLWQCVKYFQQEIKTQTILVHIFATFLQLSYTKFTLVSFNLLNRVPLHDDAGNLIGPLVVYYDGTLYYLQGDHVAYSVIAGVVMVIFVILPPIILFDPINNFKLKKVLYLMKECMQKLIDRIKRTPNREERTANRDPRRANREERTANRDPRRANREEQTANQDPRRANRVEQTANRPERIVNGEERTALLQEEEGGNIQHQAADQKKCIQLNCFTALFNAFTGEFKDGKNDDGTTNEAESDMRWFSGLYFVLRVAVFAVYAVGSNWFIQNVIQQFICVFAIVMFAILRPYKKDFYNNVDAFMFSVLVVLNTFTMCNIFLNETKGAPSQLVFIFQLLVIFVYIGFSTVFIMGRWIRKRKKGNANPQRNEEADLRNNGNRNAYGAASDEDRSIAMTI